MTSGDSSSRRLPPESFRKILELEEGKGFNDTAVVGGVDRFLQFWASDIAVLGGVEEVPESYVGMTVEERRHWVRRWLDRLDAVAGAPAVAVATRVASSPAAAPVQTRRRIRARKRRRGGARCEVLGPRRDDLEVGRVVEDIVNNLQAMEDAMIYADPDIISWPPPRPAACTTAAQTSTSR